MDVTFAAGIKATRTKYGLGLPYTAYIIQVRVEQDQNFTSWNVSRRFNAFYEINQKVCSAVFHHLWGLLETVNGLQARHPSLKGYPFPRKNRMTRYDHSFIEARSKDLGAYLTKCLEIPGVTDDPDFRTFLGFPASLMNLKARAYSIMPENIHHGEAEGDEAGSQAESSDEETGMVPPPALQSPPSERASSSNDVKPPLPARAAAPAATSSSSSHHVPPPVPSRTHLSTPQPPQDEDAIAMFDYAGSEPGELAFKTGEIVHLIESEAPSDWTAGYTSSSEKPGYFPRSFVRSFTSEDYIYNSKTATWSLREDISDFTFDPNTKTYSYNKPFRAPASSLYT